MASAILIDLYWNQPLIFGICAFTLFYLYVLHRYNYWKRKGIPYIPGKFPFGSLHKLILQKVGLVEQYHEMYNQAKSDYLGYYSFLNQQLLIKDLDLIKDVLVKNFSTFHSRGVYYNESTDPLLAHLFSIEGVRWKNVRAKLTTTFTSGKMKFVYPTVKNCAMNLQSYALQSVNENNGITDVKDMTMRYGLDVIATTALGIEGYNVAKENTDMRRIAVLSSEPSKLQMTRTIISIMCKNIAKFFPLPFVAKEVTKYFITMVEENTKYREHNDIKRNDFMQLLIDLKNNNFEAENNTIVKNNKQGNSFNLTIKEMAAHSFLFVSAGFETSSVTLGFCLYELALNQQIQEKLIAELDAAGEDISYDLLRQLPYLEMVICETLRKYPPLPILQRECSKDYVLPGGEIVDKGTLFLISVIGLHRDPKFFPNPDVFDPDRFNKENIQNIVPFSYLPFGEGPRICIAMRFGKMQVKLALVALLSRFRFEICDKTAIPIKIEKRSFAYNSAGGVWLRLKERKPV